MSKLAHRLVNIYKSLSEFTNAVFVIFFFFLERIRRAGAGSAEFIHLSSSEIFSSIGLGRSLTISHCTYDIIIYGAMTYICVYTYSNF